MSGLTLKHFILRQKILNLYRKTVRASRFLPHQSARQETIAWVRGELERHRNISDVALIESNLTMTQREISQVLPGILDVTSHSQKSVRSGVIDGIKDDP